ncbi:MAG: phosphotransferase, partial [Alicyclobacillus mali]
MYGWHQDDTDFQLLHQGENDTFLVRTRGMRYILRRYRRERYREQEILAELAWMCALRNDINVPNVIA